MRKSALFFALACLCAPSLAQPLYCTDPHRTGLLGSWIEFLPLRVGVDGRLQYRERNAVWTEWDWTQLPAYLHDAAERNPAPYLVIAIHDARVPFEKIVPIIRQAQSAGLLQVWFEAEPLPKREDQDFQTGENVICLLNPGEDYSKRQTLTLDLAPEGTLLWNGVRTDRSEVMARIGGRGDPIVRVVPGTDAKVTDVVQLMWEIAQHGSELMALDVE